MYLEANPDVKAAVELGHFKSGFHHYKKFGKHEGRPLIKILTRKDKVFYKLNKNGLGLEIGPSHNPIAPKRDGFNVRILDHADSSNLKKKYKGHEVNLENIEEVDYVWRGEDFEELVGGSEIFDWVIASHVIEHVPDLIGFLDQCNRILKKNGKLSLVIPDKRYCFDYFLPLTKTGECLDAYIKKRLRPTPGQVFDHFANASSRFNQIAWSNQDQGEATELIHNLPYAKEQFLRAINSEEYNDVHCWRFTPQSFDLTLSDIYYLGLTNFRVIEEFDTEGCEFFVTLEKNHSLAEGSCYSDRIIILKDMIQVLTKTKQKKKYFYFW